MNTSSKYNRTNYFVLLQLRILFTGRFYERVFSKSLTRTQWTSLGLIALGCALKQISREYELYKIEQQDPNKNEFNNFDIANYINWSMVLVFVQIITSSYACARNEYLLKEGAANVDLMLQNVFLYANSIMWNVLFLIYYVMSSDTVIIGLSDIFSFRAIGHVITIKVFVLIANNAALGIVTGMFLLRLNSVVRQYAWSIEFIILSVLSMAMFGFEFNFLIVFSLVSVLASVWLYLKDPVQNSRINVTST
jgi:uncharacterized membrane protein YidH (DUF202 family)